LIPYCLSNHPIEIVRGTTNAFSIAVTDKNGAPYTLETGQVLVFGLKRHWNSEDRVLAKKITGTVNGEYYLELTPADTADLEPGKYCYDVGLQHGSYVFYNVIEPSIFIIKPNVTKLGDGG